MHKPTLGWPVLDTAASWIGNLRMQIWSTARMTLKIYPRHARSLVVEALRDTRVAFVMGARQVGKSTLTISIAEHDHACKLLRGDSTAPLRGADRIRRSTHAQMRPGS